ncbi:putative multidrug resistance ABC transporter ATP-binding/permease protein YheH [Tritonibacter multivorans]|uniref:Putative multidrug resistance ABC transporter ATP-binding/permease protein YheH n=1 Tax=Tritonibacter multivorans TaxID=928856 RepID=A0A0N7M0B3_9RHOB|nr:ABC transporter transmembrane domain-containing protein [Tritonibacter multivorans]MDA7420262.1 ABC transporter transmembrane domain-containing protein [Tritonibacter multivorans]CUH79985.1 putative multidrug resistance ABC transporter ATP-binding/permease protein YheH [Tritonibacter multivorans]SFB97899.1 cyclic nucleotide-binding protein [Tritonibacter multivorans]
MEPSLFAFIWRYSRPQQIGLLLFTLASFPFLYATLELPKRIVNDAIGAPVSVIDVFGWQLHPEQYLLVLCFGFLAAVLASGLMKMRLNTLKGILSERLLRRLRYQMIARMMRFPSTYFRTTSQGEMVAMVTAESEPMGGLMGDAVAQPVFQAGQMLTIVSFLFMQSVWFGLASVALIPLQAWLIPLLQRQINLLNKDRIREVRALSAEIGETAAGLSDLRANGGWRYRLAQVSNRLGHLFEIRRRIYMKKFFMKFLNNLIGHLTPFFFYAIGGVLAIRGEITVGALVAALAAYKDLSSPWKELLTYYNQVQDMSLRWQVMTEKFSPAQMIKPELFDGEPKDIPHLRGDIELRDVVVKDSEGNSVLDGLTLTLPAGGRVAVQCRSERERAAFAQLLTREILPSSGTVTIANHPLNDLHQGVIAARIGYAYSDPYLFDGSVGDNVLMPLRNRPRGDAAQELMGRIEAVKAGNSPDTLDADWISPELAGIADQDGLRDWWFQLVEAMGIDGQLFHRTLHTRLQENHRGLEEQITALRPQIEAKLVEKGIRDAIFRFVPERYNPTLTLAENLLFAFPVQPVPETLFTDPDGPFQRLLRAEKLDLEVRQISLNLLDMLERTFGRDGTNHPLFQRIGLDEALYRRILAAAERLRSQRILTDEEKALLCTLPFLLTEEQFRPGLPETFKDLILRLRKTHGDLLLSQCKGVFRRLRVDEYARKLTVLENALFGRVSDFAGARSEAVEDAVAEVLAAHDLRARLALMLYDLPTGLGGSLLEPVFRERAAFTRAAIKRPDVLILDRALASHDAESRLGTRRKLQQLLPHTTMIYMEDHFAHPERYDVFIEIKKGRLDGIPALRQPVNEGDVADFDRKLAELRNVELFSKLDPRNRRLLAFSAQWCPVAAGEPVFLSGEPGDAVYLCLSGRAEIRWAGRDEALDDVLPGRLIGDLAVILNAPRQLDLVAGEDSLFLRIGAEEYRAVIESDASVAVELLKTVSTHLLNVTDALRQVHGGPEALENGDTGRSEPS